MFNSSVIALSSGSRSLSSKLVEKRSSKCRAKTSALCWTVLVHLTSVGLLLVFSVEAAVIIFRG